MADPFRKVQLGRTQIEVTQFGLGTAAFGWLYSPVPAEQARQSIRHAYDRGCRFFDTSPLYGSGRAESRIRGVLDDVPRESFVLSTKVGYALYPEDALPAEDEQPRRLGQDFSYDGALRLVEGSLQRLGLDRIDCLLIHDPDQQIEAALNGTYRALRRLRDEGVVGAIGAGMNSGSLLARLAREAEFDCFLLAGRYTLLDQSALDDLLPIAVEQQIGIYLGGPFNSGILADPQAAQPTFNYGPASAEWLEKARRIDAICQRYGVPTKAAALQFPLAHPAIVSVVSGARSVAEVDDNLAMMQLEIPAALWDDLRSAGLLSDAMPTP
jgi:D-threo-aldose 1-dehydrogenase